jgi:hypothetical protein
MGMIIAVPKIWKQPSCLTSSMKLRDAERCSDSLLQGVLSKVGFGACRLYKMDGHEPPETESVGATEISEWHDDIVVVMLPKVMEIDFSAVMSGVVADAQSPRVYTSPPLGLGGAAIGGSSATGMSYLPDGWTFTTASSSVPFAQEMQDKHGVLYAEDANTLDAFVAGIEAKANGK